MKVLVTGGSGFLGAALVQRLAARGDRVRSLARHHSAALAADAARAGFGIEQQLGDIGDAAAVERAVAGVDAVVHTAAKAGVWGPYAAYFRANVLGTRLVLDACRRHGVGTLVYTSSPSVVFDGHDQEGLDASAPYPRRFLAHYPRTKAEAERLVLAAHGPALATVALRPHLIWGPGDNQLVPRIVAMGRAGKLRLVGSGAKLVDAVYIDNAVEAHVLALDALSAPGPRRAAIGGTALFVTNGEPWPMARIVNGILRAAGLPEDPPAVPERAAFAVGWALELAHAALRRPGEPRLTRFVARQLATAHWYDNAAAKAGLGYDPPVSMSEGFRRLARHLGQTWDAPAN